MIDDAELLRRYADEKSEAAFAELVQRRIGLVYSVALRHTHDAHRAEDVAQAVFTALARKAASLARRPVLVGWLYRSAQFAASDAVRAESRRQVREQEAHTMQLLERAVPEPEWEKLHPVLDEVLNALDERDRDAVLLRYFDGQPFAAVGAKLSLSENAARMRVERALEKMRARLAKRGVTSTTGALALVLAHQAGVAAPAGLAASVTGVALAGGGAATAGVWLTFMSMTKLQIGIVGAIAAAGTTAFVVQGNTNADLRRAIAAQATLAQSAAALRAENQQLATAAAEVEMLRRDDAELKQLEQRAAGMKQASAEKARLAQANAQNFRQNFADKIRADDARAQAEFNRMNREGNALVEEFKVLSLRAKDPALAQEARTEADAAAQAKLEAIKLKKLEIQTFVENSRNALQQRVDTFRSLYGDDPNFPLPSFQAETGNGRLELRRSPPSGDGTSMPPVPVGDARISLGLPQADYENLISTYEHFTGTKVTRDPSLANVSGQVDFTTRGATKEETVQAMQIALRDQFHIVLEPTADGRVVARRGPPDAGNSAANPQPLPPGGIRSVVTPDGINPSVIAPKP